VRWLGRFADRDLALKGVRNVPNPSASFDGTPTGCDPWDYFWTFSVRRQERANVYVDGWNLWFAIADLGVPHLLWLSIAGLANDLVRQDGRTFGSVCYFSADPKHRSRSDLLHVVNHRTYMRALHESGVECIMGYFGSKEMTCSTCRHKFRAAEEKETDVAIGVRIAHDAFTHKFDVAYLVSCDGDYGPVARLFRDHLPSKKFVAVAIPGRAQTPSLLGLTSHHRRINRGQLDRNLLPQRVPTKRSTHIIRPAAYAPPPSSR
jgi:hypothetical protein